MQICRGAPGLLQEQGASARPCSLQNRHCHFACIILFSPSPCAHGSPDPHSEVQILLMFQLRCPCRVIMSFCRCSTVICSCCHSPQPSQTHLFALTYRAKCRPPLSLGAGFPPSGCEQPVGQLSFLPCLMSSQPRHCHGPFPAGHSSGEYSLARWLMPHLRAQCWLRGVVFHSPIPFVPQVSPVLRH